MALAGAALQTDVAEARTLLDSARSVFEAAGDRSHIGFCLRREADIPRREGRLAEAVDWVREAIALDRTDERPEVFEGYRQLLRLLRELRMPVDDVLAEALVLAHEMDHPERGRRGLIEASDAQ